MNNYSKNTARKALALTALMVSVISFASHAENQQSTPVATVDENQGCGEIILYSRPPKTKDIHYAWINQIDGQTVSTNSARFKLSAGKHRIKIIEKINSPHFTRRRGEMMNAKYIEFEIKANQKYALGAQYIRKNRSKLKTGEYWNPIVWKTTEAECTADSAA